MNLANVYLTFNGNCKPAFEHYKSVFGGEFAHISTFKDMPAEEGKELSAEMADKIVHVALPIGGDTIIMGSDTDVEGGQEVKVGNNFSISITTDSKAEADKIFNALAEGGNITMPLGDTFWGDYFGMLTDAFGVNWMMSYNAAAHNPV